MAIDSENLGIKQVEKILSREIGDWLRWGRNKDYLPVSFGSVLGRLYVPMRGDLETKLYKPAPINVLDVLEFEALVVALPVKQRQAFVMHHLNRAIVNGKVVEKKRGGAENAKLLGVHRSRYYVLLTQAHNLIFRKWQKLQQDKFEKKPTGT